MTDSRDKFSTTAATIKELKQDNSKSPLLTASGRNPYEIMEELKSLQMKAKISLDISAPSAEELDQLLLESKKNGPNKLSYHHPRNRL